MKKYKAIGLLIFLGAVWLSAKGEESYFPIGVFGIGHRGNASLVHEESCFVNLGLNFMLGCTRGVGTKQGWYEDTLMTICDENDMMLCAGSNPDEIDDFWEQLWQIYWSFDITDLYHHSWTKTIGGKTWQQRVDSCLTSMRNHYTSHPSFFGYLALHENNMKCDTCNQAAEYICQWIKQNDPNHKSMAAFCIPYMVDSTFPFGDPTCYNPTFFTDVPSLDIFYSACHGIVIPGPGGTNETQEVFDYHIKYHEKCDSVLRGKHTKWFAHLFCSKDSVIGGGLRSRRPTTNELRCMTWLALSRGAKGVAYRGYLTYPEAGRLLEGLVDTLRLPYDITNHPDDTTYSSWKWAHKDFRTLEPVLAKINFDTATSISPTKPFDSLRYITAIEDGGTGGSTPFDSLYFELATYVDVADTDYFLIVNRQILSTDTVLLSVQISDTAHQGEKRWAIDQLTKEVLEFRIGVSNLLIRIAPGDGRLFKIAEIPPWNSSFDKMTAFNNGRRLLSVPRRRGWTDLYWNLYVHELYSDGDSVYYTTKHPGLYYWTDPKAIGAGIYPALAVGRGIDCGDTLGWQMAACWIQKAENISTLYYAYCDQNGWHSPTYLGGSSLNISPPAMVVGRNYNGTSDSVHITYSIYNQNVDTVYYRIFPLSNPSSGRGTSITTLSDTIPPVIVIGFTHDPMGQIIYSIPGIMWVSGGDIYGTIRLGGNWVAPVRVYDSPDNSVKSISADVQGGNCYGTGEEEDTLTNKAKIRWGFGYVDTLPGRFFGWVSPIQTVDSLIGLPSYPHISRGVAVTYQNPDSEDVFLRFGMLWDTVWTERQNLSNSDTFSSRYPHTMIYSYDDTLSDNSYLNVLTIWTEGDTANNRYWIDSKFETFYRPHSILSAQKDPFVLPYYYLELGKESSTPFTAYRDTFVTAESYAAADIGLDSLVYYLPFFEQNYNYGMMIELPYLADNTIILKTAQLEDTIELHGKGILKYHIPPHRLAMRRDELRIKLEKLSGQPVACSRILVYQAGLKPVQKTAAGAEEQPLSLPGRFALYQNFPNPFRQTTTIKYQLPIETQVSLKIYDVTGRVIRRLVDVEQKPGYYAVHWDGRDDQNRRLATGVYFYRLETKEYKSTKKVVRLR